ncbi:MAG: hypothetical protein ACJ788_27735 [Ktedonobacteraceae bacterium]
MMHRTLVLRSFLTLAVLLASVFFTLSVIRHGMAAPAQLLTATTREFALPLGSDPWGTAQAKYGNIWVAVPGCDPSPTCSPQTPPGRFAMFNPSNSAWAGGIRLPSGYAQALFLAFDKLGNAWFPMPMNNSIGTYNTTTHTFHKWTVPTAGSGPWDIAIDGHGFIWFTEHYTNKIGRFNPTNHTFMEIATPSQNSQPYGITVDAANNVWFTENNSWVALIAEYTNQGKLLEYKIRNSYDNNLTPHLIVADKSGNIWWTEGFVGEIGKLIISQAQPGTNNGVYEYAYPRICSSCSAHTSGIGADGNGRIWFDDSLQNSFGNFPASGTGSFTMYLTPSSGSHPHDGLMVDRQNRIWFDEEFANKLARVVNT